MTSGTPQQDNFRDQLVVQLMEHVLASSTILEKISQKLVASQDVNSEQHKSLLSEIKELENKFEDTMSDLFAAVRTEGGDRCDGCLVRSQVIQDLQAMMRRAAIGSDTQRLLPITDEDLGMDQDSPRNSTTVRPKNEHPQPNWAGIALAKIAENKIFWICVLLVLIAIITAWNLVDVVALIQAWKGVPNVP